VGQVSLQFYRGVSLASAVIACSESERVIDGENGENKVMNWPVLSEEDCLG